MYVCVCVHVWSLTFVVEGAQEAQGPEVETHDRGHGAAYVCVCVTGNITETERGALLVDGYIVWY